MKTRMFTLGAGAAVLSMAGTLVAPGVAEASSKGRKNTAIGLGAAAAQQLLTGKTTNGVVLGAGAAYAYKRYKDAERDENRSKRSATYRSNSYRSQTRNGGTVAGTRSTSRSRYGAANTNGRLYPETKSAYVPNGSYYFTGKVIGGTSDLTNRNITIDHNGVSRRVHIPKSATVLHASQSMSMHELRNGDMVRVLAVRTPDRWNASRVELLSAVDADRVAANRDPFGDTYTRRNDVTTTTRTASSRYNGTGVIERVERDGRSFDVRVGSNLRTVYTDEASFRGIGGASELREGDRVRVVGSLDGSDVNAEQIILVE